MKMGAHELRERLRFERRAAGGDGYGNSEGAWSLLCERPARLQPQRGGEAVQAARLAGNGPWEVVVRFDSATRTLTTGDRAVHVVDGRVFNIRWGEDVERKKQWWVMLAETGVADG